MKLFSTVIKKWRKEWLNGKIEVGAMKSFVYLFLAIVKNENTRKGHYHGKKALFP